jgi:hypothetical protein
MNNATSSKVRSSILSSLEKIREGVFEENDIKLLLIDIREDIRDESLLRELADFVAHPSRDRGIINSTLNNRHLKLDLMFQQIRKLKPQDWENLKTEADFSRYLLGSVDIRKVERDVFEVLFVEGLRDLDEALFIKHYQLRKKHVERLRQKAFKLDRSGKYYVLADESYYTVMFELMSFVRGTFQARPAFTQKSFEKDLESAVRKVLSRYHFDRALEGFVRKRRKEILLCIMCLLHDAKFEFRDGHIASCYLALDEDVNPEDWPPPPISGSSRLILMSDGMAAHMPVFVSNILARECIPIADAELSNLTRMGRIPWVNARRNENKSLMLVA